VSTSHLPEPGNALWMYAHPRRGSFNDQLFQTGTQALAHRYQVAVSDLYAQNFDPVLSERDLGTVAGQEGNIGELGAQAYEQGQLPVDVVAEQRKLAAAELLVLQFPLWWWGPPAIMKGWFDRVLVQGFAYGDMDAEFGVPRRYGDGKLAGRKALIVVTVGEDPRSIGPRGISGDIDSLLFPLTHGMLWYLGMEALDPHVIYDANSMSAAGVAEEAERLQQRLQGLESEPIRQFRRLRDGDYKGTRALREDVLPGRSDFGIHFASDS
jgi:NAD(P)H dehydrogenase (quinone)